MAAECCSSCEFQRTVGYPSTSWASCYYICLLWHRILVWYHLQLKGTRRQQAYPICIRKKYGYPQKYIHRSISVYHWSWWSKMMLLLMTAKSSVRVLIGMQAAIKVCWTCTSVTGRQKTQRNTCRTSTTWSLSPSIPICRRLNSK